ncbi:MAG: right-handed parallel beta-helix repeat-containing protein [Limnochordia bacterium]
MLTEYDASRIGVKSFGAKGDGVTDDTAAIQAACETRTGQLHFPQGTYVIRRTIVIDMAKTGRLSLLGSGATVRHVGPGPAFHLIGHHHVSANPEQLDPEAYAYGAMPLIQGIIVEGAHPDAEGICLETTFQATLSSLVVRDCRHGIHIVGNNRNVLIDGVHVYNNRGVGIYLDHVNLHQINICASHVSYNGGGGIKVEEGNIRNIQIAGNDIEYNYEHGGSDVWFIAGKIGIREGAITGNTIQAVTRPGGANVRIEGYQPESPLKAGLLSIAGNHISNQEINVHIKDSRGIVIGNNTFTRGEERNICIERSTLIDVNHCVLDSNPDYGERLIGGIRIADSSNCMVQGVTVSECHGGTPERGGALEVVGCERVMISNCILTDSRHRDVWLEDVHTSHVSGLIVRRSSAADASYAAITESGQSNGNMIVNNTIVHGGENPIVAVGDQTIAAGNLIQS